MFIIRKILLYLTPLLFILGAEFIREYRELWWVMLVVSGLLLVVTVFDYTKRKLNARFFNFLITPFALFLSTYLVLFYLDSLIVYRGVTFGTAIFLFLILDQTLNYFYFSMKYQPYTLESFSFYTNILSMFYWSVSLFSTLIFLHYNRFIIAAIGLLMGGVLVYQLFWINKISWQKSQLFVYVIPIVLAELFLAISYLPSSFYVNAFLLTISFYLMVGLARLFLQENLNKKNVTTHILISAVSVILIIVTAQWG